MPRLANKELQKRKVEMAARSREAIAKKELVQFRLDSEKIVELYEVAANYKTHMGTMLRQWVSERLTQELSRKHTSHLLTKADKSELFVKESTTGFFQADDSNKLIVTFPRFNGQ